MKMRAKYLIKDFLEVKSAGDASFSPDEKQVAYLSSTTGVVQAFLISAKGGEPEQLTDSPDPISFIRFSPTQNVVIFGKAIGGNEQTQFFLLNLDTREITDLTGRPDVRHDFGAWSPDGKSICFTSNERNGKDFDAYVMDVATRQKRCIFEQGEWCYAEGFSPKSNYIVIRKKYSNANTDLYLCNLNSGAIDHITPHEGNGFYMRAVWLPDESAFFIIQDKDREYNGLARYSLSEKRIEYVFTPEWDVETAILDRKGKRIAITVNEEGYSRLLIGSPSDFKFESFDLPKGSQYQVRFSESGSKITFSLRGSRQASDVWILDLDSKESRQLTHSPQGVPPDAMVEPELVHFSSFDGLSIPAFIYRPKEIKPGAKVPVLINIHGGPEDQYQPTYQPVMQYLVHSGYAVIAPNIRGSSGYGKSYMALDDVEKRLDSVKDIVALRSHIEKLPDLDENRIALYGASYGGFMVLACLAFHPELWAAGVDIVGIVNFETFLENTAPYRRAAREAEYGSLEHHREVLRKISPIHSIQNIQAPLFLIHGKNDPRVPLSEAEQVVTKLKEIGREVELLVYPDEGHGLSKLKNRLDAFPKVVDFLNKSLRN